MLGKSQSCHSFRMQNLGSFLSMLSFCYFLEGILQYSFVFHASNGDELCTKENWQDWLRFSDIRRRHIDIENFQTTRLVEIIMRMVVFYIFFSRQFGRKGSQIEHSFFYVDHHSIINYINIISRLLLIVQEKNNLTLHF